MKLRSLSLALLTALIVLAVPFASMATTYDVYRSFSGVTLTGTVSVDEGIYTIQNASASPFTNVDLTLTLGGSSYHLTYADTEYVLGTGKFVITATPTQLIFNALNGDGGNPADIGFLNAATYASADIMYGIGYDGAGGFEVFIRSGADRLILSNSVDFPVVFGTTAAVPVPAAVWLLGSGLLGLCGVRRKIVR